MITPNRWGTLSARHSGKAMDIDGADTASATRAVQSSALDDRPSQLFRFEPLPFDGSFRIRVKHSMKYLTVDQDSQAAGAAVIQFDWLSRSGQQFGVEALDNGFTVIRSRLSGHVLDVLGGSTADRARIIQWTPTGGPNQMWWHEPSD